MTKKLGISVKIWKFYVSNKKKNLWRVQFNCQYFSDNKFWEITKSIIIPVCLTCYTLIASCDSVTAVTVIRDSSDSSGSGAPEYRSCRSWAVMSQKAVASAATLVKIIGALPSLNSWNPGEWQGMAGRGNVLGAVLCQASLHFRVPLICLVDKITGLKL